MIQQQKIIGTVVPISALVSKIADDGTFATARVFVEWLAKSKQSAWQILPLHETQLKRGSRVEHVPSPYKGYGIGMDPKYLGRQRVALTKTQIMKFTEQNQSWLPKYSLFCAVRDYFGSDEWATWPRELRRSEPDAIHLWERKLSKEIAEQVARQTALHLKYAELRKDAANRAVRLIGDMPFYLSLNSPLVWQFQDVFELDVEGKMRRVSGIPQGPRSHFGRQVWGHPLYRWQEPALKVRIDKLFAIRMEYLGGLYDIVRLDHAKGLFAYGALDPVNKMADRYLQGPGSKTLAKYVGYGRSHGIQIYAEDTGDKLRELRKSLRVLKVPGIRIFRFAYNEKKQTYDNNYLQTKKYPADTFACTTTHDTETLVGYLASLTRGELRGLAGKAGVTVSDSLEEVAKAIRQRVIESPAKWVLIPLQDWLLTTERINVPGTEREVDDPNWQYRMSRAIENLPLAVY